MKRKSKKTQKAAWPGGTVPGTDAPEFNRANIAHVEASNALAAPANRDRAFRIAQIEPEYFGAVCDTKEDFVTGLLTDVRHYCDVNRLDFAHRDSIAYQHYAEENGKADSAPPAGTPQHDVIPAPAAPGAAPAQPKWGFEIKYLSAEEKQTTGYSVLRDPRGEYAGTVPDAYAAQIVAALNRAAPQPAGTGHYLITWTWTSSNAGRFGTEADLTPEQADEIEADLKERAREASDICDVEVYVWDYPPLHQSLEQLRAEIVSALDGDTCPTCFASLDDPEHDCANGQHLPRPAKT